ncbi:hypothetical protein [Nocardioides sp. GXQ0305]|uniref:hypothetical protein n=1 Tax=Nocardioides sp. GXQ0305 TaxID=3423912 RepID=UPI003D7E080E
MSLAASNLQPDPLGAPASAGQAWRAELRRTLSGLRDLLVAESPAAYDGWLAAREARATRERTLLLRRVAALRDVVQTASEAVARAEVTRLRGDVDRHRRRARDLQWDSVQLELGGSE